MKHSGRVVSCAVDYVQTSQEAPSSSTTTLAGVIGMLLLSFGVVIRDTADANIAARCDVMNMDADEDSFNQWIPVYLVLAIWWTT